MPGPIHELISLPTVASIRVELEPTYNAIHSLILLVRSKNLSGLNDWVTRTAGALTPEELHTHSLVVIGFHYAITPLESWSSFPAYIGHLEALTPIALRDKLLNAYAKISPRGDEEPGECVENPFPVDMDPVLENVDTFLDFLRERFAPSHIDEGLESEAYTYIVDPPAMQRLIVSHLRKMWEEHLAPEWDRVTPMLKDAVTAFRQIDFSNMSKLEAARSITDQELNEEKWGMLLERVEQVVFIPSAHVGPYLGSFLADNTLRVLFGARLPEGIKMHAPDLSRAEIIVRLNALADDNRLRILKFIAENGEQRSQNIMSHLEFSQSAASRHLKQLTATGFLSERRCEGAKCYDINPELVEDTLYAISNFLLFP